MRAALLLAFLTAAVGVPDTAGAQPDDIAGARAEFARGESLFAAARYGAAAAAYRRSFELSDRPGLLFNIGQALRLGGDAEGAASAYREFLARIPDGALADVARMHLAAVERRIAEDALPPATLRFRAAPVAEPVATVRPTLRVRASAPDRGPMVAGGALLRVAVDAGAMTGSLLAGGAVELGSRVELSAAAILGATRGAYGGAALFFGGAALRPLVAAGVPVFFHDRTLVAVRGAAGLAWSPSRQLMLTAEIGVEELASPPAGFARTLVVPALSLRGHP